MLLAYGIVEEAYLLYAKKWIDEDNWQQWSAFLERLAGHPMFARIHETTSGTFDKGFESYVSNEILMKKKGGEKRGLIAKNARMN